METKKIITVPFASTSKPVGMALPGAGSTQILEAVVPGAGSIGQITKPVTSVSVLVSGDPAPAWLVWFNNLPLAQQKSIVSAYVPQYYQQSGATKSTNKKNASSSTLNKNQSSSAAQSWFNNLPMEEQASIACDAAMDAYRAAGTPQVKLGAIISKG